MSEADNRRREFLKKAALLGGAGVAGAALTGGLGPSVLGSPPPTATSVTNQWDQIMTPSCIVFADSNGSYYVKDTGIGSELGGLIVDTSAITDYGASLGAGTSGASTTTAGIQEAINCLPEGGLIFVQAGTYNFSTGIYIAVNGIHLLGAGRDATVLNFTGNVSSYHGIFASPGATSPTDTNATVSVPMTDLVLADFSVNLNSTLASFNSNETSGTCVKAVATQGGLFSRLNLYGMATYGLHVHAGNASGSASAGANDNVMYDCRATVTGVVGFYTDSGYPVGATAYHNSNPNRGNRWIGCTATCSSKITTQNYNPAGFLTCGEIGTRFTDCVSEGFLGNSVGSNIGVGFLVQGVGTGICFDSCGTIENDYGIYLQSATGVSIVNHVSWYDRYFSIGNAGGKDYGVQNLQIKNLICMDLGGSGHEGRAISLRGGVTLAPSYVDIDAMRGFMTGLNSPIYGQSPLNYFAILNITGGSHWRVRGVDAAQLVSLGAPFLTVSGTNSDIVIRDCPGFNPLNQVANPFGTASSGVLGFGGAAAVPVASKDYVVIYSDIFISAANSSNNDNSITIKDGAGNTVQPGLSTLTALYVPAGYKINWGPFTGTAGAVTVWGI
ncbi:MAG: hypothetical protein OK442_01755 [Thaumarchaeota archaeon]|nr:hypothetical protein [Nitrososphaerota archaeon]